MKVLGIDLETRNKEDIKKVGGYRYAENCEILLFAYAYDEDPVQVIDMASGEEIPRFVISDVLDNPDVLKVAYNAQFERTVLSNYFRSKGMLTGWLDASQWLCTMVLGMTLGLPAGLDALGKVLGLSEDKAKMAIGKKLIQKFCKPDRKGNFVLPSEAPEDWKTFIEYNRRDVETERTLRKMMWKYVPSPTERKLWALDQRINDRGVHIDQKLAKNAIAIDTECRDEVMEEARELTGLQNPSSNAQLKVWLQEQEGWDEPPASLTKTTIPELIEKCKNEDCKRALELKLKLGKTSTKKYQTMLDTVCKDGNVHGLLQFYGASRTGRWAGRLVQTQNLPRCYLEDLDDARGTVLLGDREIMEFLYENIPDTLSQLIRTAFTASPGCRFIDADFSAIEARVIAWLAKEEWRQEVFRKNGDIYCASASQMFHVPVEKHGINGHLRQKGKIAELALGYNGSIGALKNMGADKMGLSDEELKSIVVKWREASPHIVELWHNMQAAAINAVLQSKHESKGYMYFKGKDTEADTNQNADMLHEEGYMDPDRDTDVDEFISNRSRIKRIEMHGTKTETPKPWKIPNANLSFVVEGNILFMQLPSRRRIAYYQPELEEGEYGLELTYHGVNQTTRQWTKLRTYGGKLTENAVQSIARDCLATAMLRLDEAGYPIVMHIHDEVVADMPEGKGSLDDAVRIMSQPISWAPGLVLNADGWEDKYFKKE